MEFPQPTSTTPDDASTPPSDATLPYDPKLDVNNVLALPFTLDDLRALLPPHPQYSPTEYSFALARRSSSFPSTAYPPSPMLFSLWNNVPSNVIGPSMSSPASGPSEPSVYMSRYVSGDNVALTGTQPLPHEQEAKFRSIFPSSPVPSLSGEQATSASASSYPKHVVSWYHVCANAVIVNGPRRFVPQTIYQPHSQGDKERYVSLAKLHPPITFLADDSPEWGVPIQHLLSKQLVRLVEGGEPAFSSCGPSIGIRLQATSRATNRSRQETTHERHMISKVKLAQVVAKSVKQFMDAMTEQVMEVGSDRQWRVGPLGIRVDDIILVSLHHVSQGSWQPQLRLRGYSAPNAVQDHRIITGPDTRIRPLGD